MRSSSEVSVERRLQVNIAVLAVVGTTLLGIVEANFWFPLAALVVAPLATELADRRHWFHVNARVANLLALAAAVYSLFQFFGHDAEEQLAAIANLLVFLQFILLFERKTLRVYWQLIILGLLQVVVAAVLSLAIWVGVWLVMYTVLGICALTLLFLFQQSQQFFAPPNPPSRSRRQVRGGGLDPTSCESPLCARPRAEFSLPPGAVARSSLSRHVPRQIAALAMATFVFALILFCVIPRRGNNAWSGPQRTRTFGSESGFAPHINLGAREDIHLGDEPVLRIAFEDEATGKRIELLHEPYIRGAILVHYDSRHWQPPRFARRALRSLKSAPERTGMVRQEVWLAHATMDDDELVFGVFPVYHAAQSPGLVRLNNANEQLVVSKHTTLQNGRTVEGTSSGPMKFQYLLRTSAIQNHRQTLATTFDTGQGPMSADVRKPLCDFDQRRLANLHRRANEIIANQAVEAAQSVHIARALEAHFLEPNRYTYTLELSTIVRNKSLDPVEDFVLNHHCGHCEYFASALALMLRSVGIPSRIVLGYKGGEYNPVGKYYDVNQGHAHAWVEAYIAPEQITPELASVPGATTSGVWLRLDPTPSRSEPARMTQFAGYVQFLWGDYVLGMNSQHQEDSLLGALRSDAPLWQGLDPKDVLAADRIDWRIALGTTVVALLCISCLSLVKRRHQWKLPKGLVRALARGARFILPHWRWRSGLRRDEIANQPSATPFYDRLIELLAAHNVRRSRHQTPREFAEFATRQLPPPGLNGCTPLLHQVVAGFYQVRFGGHSLQPHESAELERAVSQLESTLADAGDCQQAPAPATPPAGPGLEA